MSKLVVDLTFLKELKQSNPNYIRKVIDNFRGYEAAIVVFGEMGIGRMPNYEITLPNGIKLSKNGSNHKPYTFDDNVPKEERFFNPNNVSIAFKLAEMKNL